MILSGKAKLQGIVEVDEVLVGGKVSGKRGRGAEGKSLMQLLLKQLEEILEEPDWPKSPMRQVKVCFHSFKIMLSQHQQLSLTVGQVIMS